MFYNPTQLPGKAALNYFGGYYFHDLLRTDDGWRSRHLREEAVWSVNGADVARLKPGNESASGLLPEFTLADAA